LKESTNEKETVKKLKDKKIKEEPLINFESGNASSNWSSKLEDDAWDILKD
jgi:ADP-ribosylation factor GTPase-activating protein 1